MNTAELIEAIKNYNPRPKPIEVPAWGQTVYIKPLTVEHYASIRAKGDETPYYVLMCIAGVCDENGKALFTRADIPVLMQATAGPVWDLGSKVVDFTNEGLSDADAKKS